MTFVSTATNTLEKNACSPFRPSASCAGSHPPSGRCYPSRKEDSFRTAIPRARRDPDENRCCSRWEDREEAEEELTCLFTKNIRFISHFPWSMNNSFFFSKSIFYQLGCSWTNLPVMKVFTRRLKGKIRTSEASGVRCECGKSVRGRFRRWRQSRGWRRCSAGRAGDVKQIRKVVADLRYTLAVCKTTRKQCRCQSNLVKVVDHNTVDQVFGLCVLRFGVEIAFVLRRLYSKGRKSWFSTNS